jgi:hypothetical protein
MVVNSFASQFPSELIHGKVKLKTDIYEVARLAAAISSFQIYEEGKLMYFDDYVKIKALVDIEAELRKRLLKAEQDHKENFSMTFTVLELLILFDQVKYYKTSHRYLVRIMNKIGMAAARYARFIYMEDDDQEALKP